MNQKCKEEIKVMKKGVTRSLAFAGEKIVKFYSNVPPTCVFILHEPKMPEALIKKISEKELWKK